MSESPNCAEQREEQTELEETGGAEVRRFKMGIVDFQYCSWSSRPTTKAYNNEERLPYLRGIPIWLR